MSPKPNRRHVVLAGGALAAPWLRAQTPSKVVYGYSGVTDFASVFIAIDEGLFQRRGLEVEARFLPLSPAMVPALQADTLQIGGLASTSFLQAVESGVDHVVLGGGGVLSKAYTETGLVARAGAGIRSAADCVGRKIGVPGLGAILHVSFRQWLTVNRVDAKQVAFIEAPFPQHAEMIRSGTLDAVVTSGPFMARILDGGNGYVAAYYSTFLPEGFPTIVHAARRDWVLQNPAAVKAFRAGIVEAAAFIRQPRNEARVRDSCARYLKLPPEVAARMQIAPPGPVVTPQQLQWWAGLMKQQGMLSEVPPFERLVAKPQ